MKNKFIILVIFIPFIINGQSVWVKYGNQVFKGVGDAKSISLSESEIASGSGPLSILYNPSLLNDYKNKQIVYSHQERFSGSVVFDIIGIDLKKNNNSNFSLAFIRESVQGIPNTNNALLNNSSSLNSSNQRIIPSKVTFFNQSQLATIIGFSKLFSKISIGTNVKILNHNIADYNGWGIGFDLGAAYKISNNNKIGLSVRDITTSWIVWDSGTIERIFPEMRVGGSNILELKKHSIEINSMISSIIKFSGREIINDLNIGDFGFEHRFGIELIYKKNLKIRFGRNPINGKSIGIGTKIKLVELDYAYLPSPSGTILGNSHYISLNIGLDDLVKLYLN